ncbi:hypothetical protein JTE90_011757 [Oedothorax gibbosus]|uniref:Uncharacterized protein n=1 Tax=Oedothorax gibbosus TaxID=931172 RepID=A0AAV6VRH6_9ARAC|nr:hypothetical protein JTE90_011757 [Oedothorax gibbosus]
MLRFTVVGVTWTETLAGKSVNFRSACENAVRRTCELEKGAVPNGTSLNIGPFATKVQIQSRAACSARAWEHSTSSSVEKEKEHSFCKKSPEKGEK